MKKRKVNSVSRTPKQKNFKNIEEIIQTYLIPKIKAKSETRRFKKLTFSTKNAASNGPYIREEKKGMRSNWVAWSLERSELFKQKISEVFAIYGMSSSNFKIEFVPKQNHISIQEIDPEEIPHHEPESNQEDKMMSVQSSS